MKRLVHHALSSLLLVSLLLTGCSSNNKKPQATASVNPANTTQNPDSTTDNLRQLADQRGILVGAAIEPNFLDEPQYAKILKENYNFITPENRMKWGFIQPKKGIFDFKGADKIVDFALSNNMKVRGHTLVWHIENPSWLTSGNFSKEEMLKILENHIKTVVGHYKGKVHAWDVVNEVIDVYTLRNTLWLEKIGPEYIEKAFQWAHEADPDAKLYMNDFFIEEKGVKSDYYYKYVKELLAKKVPIHGIGFQCHFDMQTPPDMGSIYDNVKRFADLGLEVDFTEVDFRIYGYADEAQLKNQAEAYSQLMNIALNFDKVKVFTMWGLTDKHSWVPVTYPESGDAHIFDKEYKPKPAYNALVDALKKGPVKIDYEALKKEALKKRVIVPPFAANPVTNPPVIDGRYSAEEWKDAVVYPFAYNQLNENDLRPPQDLKNISGTWRVVYNKNKLYGMIERNDNKTVSQAATEYENDCIELFTEHNGEVNQIRALIGEDWSFNPAAGERKAVWSKDGKIVEFSIEVPAEKDLAGITMGWNTALTDSDDFTGGRTFQLYPVNGANTSWQGKDLSALYFVGEPKKPAPKEYTLPPFMARKALRAPTIDGTEDPGVWDNAIKYKLAFNQLNPKDQSSPKDAKDCYAEWRAIFDKNSVFLYITRIDDKTVTNNANPAENDNVEVSIRPEDTVNILRTVVGKDFDPGSYNGKVKAAWNKEGTVLELGIELPVEDLAGTTIPWNLSISDNDSENGKRKYQLYPVHTGSAAGENSLCELSFEK
ncbi:MAG TPA: endo-1,4-beta-xylanase [Pseudobacteroides sp.]|uniref:endo-1,4-beta-xylanase n=1 Tax=Pseudobacteroides sp. TaxID=1968840 RepID=UPI002F93A5DA